MSSFCYLILVEYLIYNILCTSSQKALDVKNQAV